ncbi:MAG TPA: uridine diphosphate-N-acetylglucosamine-binding protein YvcK, partial [Anaerolineae bacterium]|nr:uridine diphosphate-N-acetylglucosamine-binding protein YvcK [Anaerolineae bacterium]
MAQQTSHPLSTKRLTPWQRLRAHSFWKWLTPGIGVKRWLALFLLGITLLSLALTVVLIDVYRNVNLPDVTYYLTLQFLPRFARALIVGLLGVAALAIAVYQLSRSILSPFTRQGSKPVAQALVEHRQRERGPKVVAIGGGTGLSTLLRSLKQHTSNITAIVTVADDGGSSGRLRRELGVLPPGDFRNCLAALADDEALTTQLFQYRFSPSQQDLDGHALGNLFITAMADIAGSFEQALIESSHVLAITGRIMPSTLSDVTLCAEVRSGVGLEQVEGESNITHRGGSIERVFLKPDRVRAYPETIRAILDADLIVLGPGSLYTSVLPNLLIDAMPEALRASRAIKLYVCNVATQHGETDGYSVHDHVRALEKHIGTGILDVVLANSSVNVRWNNAPAGVGEIVRFTMLEGTPRITAADVIDEACPWRHDSDKLAQAVIQTYHE